MASTPYGRVAYLLGLSDSDLPEYMTWHKRPTQTPTTLSGCPQHLESYALTIAYRDGADWMIYDGKNSLTTNRHISAVRAVIESQGYGRTSTVGILKRGFDRHDVYRRYQKPA